MRLLTETVPVNNFLLTGNVPRGLYVGGKVQIRLCFFLYCTACQHRTQAPRGMASQHLLTFERVPVNKKLLTGTVPVNSLFLFNMLLLYSPLTLVRVMYTSRLVKVILDWIYNSDGKLVCFNGLTDLFLKKK